jgi:hypothetical protein
MTERNDNERIMNLISERLNEYIGVVANNAVKEGIKTPLHLMVRVQGEPTFFCTDVSKVDGGSSFRWEKEGYKSLLPLAETHPNLDLEIMVEGFNKTEILALDFAGVRQNQEQGARVGD